MFREWDNLKHAAEMPKDLLIPRMVFDSLLGINASQENATTAKTR